MGLPDILEEVRQIPPYHRYGRVTGVLGLLLEVSGVPQSLAVGGRCDVLARDGRRVPCEVVGFRNEPGEPAAGYAEPRRMLKGTPV